MLRAVLGVIVGYLVMVILIFVSFAAAFMVMGVEGSYKPGSWEVSTAWVIMSLAVGVIVAIIGGYVCALIAARGSRAPIAFAVIVLVLGLAQAAYSLVATDGDPPARPEGEIAMADAIMSSRPPAISLMLNPFLGAVGILIGARLRGGPGPVNDANG